MRTTKGQIRLRIRAVWSGPLLSAYTVIRVLQNITKYSKLYDRPIYLRWLIWTFTVCVYPEDTFSHLILIMSSSGLLRSCSASIFSSFPKQPGWRRYTVKISEALWREAHHENALYSFDPHKLHFYIGQLGFTEVYIIFRISAQKHRLWVLVRTASSRRF